MRCGDALRGAASNRRHSFTSRVEALALLQTLNAELVSHDSATLTLDRWCESHNLASPAHIVAERMQGVDRPPTAEQRRLLRVSASEPVRYRRVRRGPGLHPPPGTTAACRASNMAFLGYGLPLGMWPVAVLRALLLPLNILRLFQIRRVLASIRVARTGEIGVGPLMCSLALERHAQGTVLFRKGDWGDCSYFIA